MTKIEKLTSQLNIITNDVAALTAVYLAKKKELVAIESDLVEAREAERNVKDKIDAYRNEFEIEHSLDDERAAEIEGFRSRMADAMSKIENEKPIEKVWSGSIGVVKGK